MADDETPYGTREITSHPGSDTTLVYSMPTTHHGRPARFFLDADGHVEVWTADGERIDGRAERLTERARLLLLGWLAERPGGPS